MSLFKKTVKEIPEPKPNPKCSSCGDEVYEGWQRRCPRCKKIICAHCHHYDECDRCRNNHLRTISVLYSNNVSEIYISKGHIHQDDHEMSFNDTTGDICNNYKELAEKRADLNIPDITKFGVDV